MTEQNNSETFSKNQRPEGVEWRLESWFPELGKDKLELLYKYLIELLHFNRKINLISPRTEKSADQLHFADSILATEIILNHTDSKEIYDIGSGNGMPGLVMAIFDPNRKFYLVESDNRKCEFLKHMTTKLDLNNVEVINMRLENLPESSINCAVSRGFASISKAILSARRPSAPGCTYYHLKSDSWSREFAEIPVQIISHWKPGFIKAYRLPESDIDLSIVYTEKKQK